eukprot:symbB.v1.2.041472.t1/scaffold8252.1/size7087/1
MSIQDLWKGPNGEYVALTKVEAALKLVEFVEMPMVYGKTGGTYPIALICPVKPSIEKLAKQLDISGDFVELCTNEKIVEKVFAACKAKCKEMKLVEFEIPQRMALISDAWTPENDLLTAAMKLKRPIIADKHKPATQGQALRSRDNSASSNGVSGKVGAAGRQPLQAQRRSKSQSEPLGKVTDAGRELGTEPFILLESKLQQRCAARGQKMAADLHLIPEPRSFWTDRARSAFKQNVFAPEFEMDDAIDHEAVITEYKLQSSNTRQFALKLYSELPETPVKELDLDGTMVGPNHPAFKLALLTRMCNHHFGELRQFGGVWRLAYGRFNPPKWAKQLKREELIALETRTHPADLRNWNFTPCLY